MRIIIYFIIYKVKRLYFEVKENSFLLNTCDNNHCTSKENLLKLILKIPYLKIRETIFQVEV